MFHVKHLQRLNKNINMQPENTENENQTQQIKANPINHSQTIVPRETQTKLDLLIKVINHQPTVNTHNLKKPVSRETKPSTFFILRSSSTLKLKNQALS